VLVFINQYVSIARPPASTPCFDIFRNLGYFHPYTQLNIKTSISLGLLFMAAFLRLPRCTPPAQPVLFNVYPACPTCPMESLLLLFHRDGIFLSHSIGVKSLLHLFLWGAFLEIQRLFNRDGISFALISSGWLK